MHIAHPHIGDLVVQLECPSGQTVTLYNHGGGRKKNLDATYRIKQCESSNIVGNWKLRISDDVHFAAGSLLSWTLYSKADKPDAPIFRINDIKDWNLIGNSIAPGNDRLKVYVAVSGEVVSMGGIIDGGVSQPLTKTDTGFDGNLDVSRLPSGIHMLFLSGRQQSNTDCKAAIPS